MAFTRIHSDPTLERRDRGYSESGDEATVGSCDSDGSALALGRPRRKAGRRKGQRSKSPSGMRILGGSQNNHNTVTVTKDPAAAKLQHWKDMVAGTVLLGAFVACVSVFVLLGQQKESAELFEQECDARTLLQLKLASYIYNGGNMSMAVTTTDGAAALGSLAATESCGCPGVKQMEDFENILYVLLVGALLTVVGVSILLMDDSEGAGAISMSTNLLSTAVQDFSERYSTTKRKPVADLFPDTTLLMADIVGFEAWSSQREPTQCLTLLETIYDVFDREARLQGVFKVEAVADCYTAATGLPDARDDHAEAMTLFAIACMKLFKETTKSLEVSLGPDTSDLGIRFGLHSGPVTALRGGSSRFQLFGDTVTTTATILNTSQSGKIQLSQETHQLLPGALQNEWTKPRDASSRLHWFNIPGQQEADDVVTEDDRIPRLVDWNVSLLSKVLQEIVTKRQANKPNKPVNEEDIDQRLRQGKLVIEEVEEVIKLPKYDAALAKAQEEQESQELSQEVVDQLREYIMTIAKSYKNNPFHNFAHASHVTMSVSKLLSRILAPKLDTNKSAFDPTADKSEQSLHIDDDEDDESNTNVDLDDLSDDDDQESIDEDLKRRLHDHTYGITSDPLTQFACMFSALIHDTEHDGVPNAQLVKEETELAAKYKNQSVAEQNSVDIAWQLLMEPRFKELRNAIYSTEEEMIHFRQLVVNCVMATDICDKQLKELRNNRWERAFAEQSAEEKARPDPAVMEENVNRKATIVIEHLIQASDVSHTMQHFHVFRKWNERLFLEMYLAWRNGRSTANPSKFWYKGEIGFFDFYVIPLAKKLKECGVFGVSSGECLNYATKNRQEWEAKGERIVEALVAKAENTYEILERNKNVDLKATIHRKLSSKAVTGV